jgi:hypothetical protein
MIQIRFMTPMKILLPICWYLGQLNFSSEGISSEGECGKDSIAGKPRIGFQQFLNGGSPDKFIKDLLDGDSGFFDGWFAEKYVGIGCDPISVFWHGFLQWCP